MSDKEGGDSEKKMTKDFLDRWKKIATKYEGPEGDAGKPKDEAPGEAPAPGQPASLDEAAKDLSETGKEGDHGDEEELELDDLMVDFGLQGDAEASKAKKGAPKPAVPAKAAPPARVARPPVAPPPPADDPQKRVLETLKKVGLVRDGAAPPPPPPPKAPPAPAPEEEEDTLLLELETLLSDESGTSPDKGKPAAAPSSAALEEEDLIAELEGLLEGSGEEEAAPPPKVPAVAPVKASEQPPFTIEAKAAAAPAIARAAIVPPEAPKGRVAEPAPSGGRVNGGRVNGGRVNGGRVNGGRVNGGRVNGGRVNGGRVNGGRVNGGRVNGGRVNGGRVNGGRVNGGRVNGGRVNGGKVNGGRVNGGRVNGSRVNGGRGGMIGGAAPAIRMQTHRQTAIVALVSLLVFMGLFSAIPLGTSPRAPSVDGDISDWAGTGALIFSDAADAAVLPPALDLREYAIRTDAARLWFEAQAAAGLFARSGTFPARADYFLLLIDVDGQPSTGYSYHGLGVDRVVDVYGWNGSMRVATTRAWSTVRATPQYDYSGFDTAGGLQIAVRGDRIEGTLTSIAQGDAPTALANARAIFELRGLDATGQERIDASAGPAVVAGSSLSATVVPIAPGALVQGSSAMAPMLNISLANPSPLAAQVTAVRLTAEYSPAAPTDLVTVGFYRDSNGNGRADATEEKLTAAPVGLPQMSATAITFPTPLVVPPNSQVDVLATVEHVSSTAANGTSVKLSVAATSDIVAASGTAVTLFQAPTLPGAQPLSYFGAAPAATVVDGNTLEWASRLAANDPADASNSHIDLRSLQGLVTPTAASFLVSMRGAPLEGALIPFKLAQAIELPSSGGGQQGPPGPAPLPTPTSGADVLWILIEADNSTVTGFVSVGRGYDYAIRIEGKGGRVLPDGAAIYEWNTSGTAGWARMPTAIPQVGVGATAVEVGAALPPLVLTARNVTVTAYATDWQGARDDMAQPLTLGNSQGTRATELPQTPAGGPEGDGGGYLPIPEFQDIAVPAASLMIIMFISRRRRRARSVE